MNNLTRAFSSISPGEMVGWTLVAVITVAIGMSGLAVLMAALG